MKVIKRLLKILYLSLTGKVCQSLRDYNWQASTINIKLRYSDFQTISRSKTIKPTNDDKVIFDTALEMMKKAFTRRVAVRLIGIGLSKFNEFAEQEVLFEDDTQRRKKLLNAVDVLRKKYNYEIINLGLPDKDDE